MSAGGIRILLHLKIKAIEIFAIIVFHSDAVASKKNIAVFTGAGISAESGIKTFRDSGGLWEEFDINDVATPEAWDRNYELVLDFYNQRRKQVFDAQPNAAHYAIAALEKKYHVDVITQNIDDLHEKAGSKNILHLHGEIKKARSTADPELVYELETHEIRPGDKCEKGSQLRPHIVWFGEEVPAMTVACELVSKADILIVIGTSLNVYPAASLIYNTRPKTPIWLVDPHARQMDHVAELKVIKENATAGVVKLVDDLLK
jgi:NAD-dependent deacetylase